MSSGKAGELIICENELIVLRFKMTRVYARSTWKTTDRTVWGTCDALRSGICCGTFTRGDFLSVLMRNFVRDDNVEYFSRLLVEQHGRGYLHVASCTQLMWFVDIAEACPVTRNNSQRAKEKMYQTFLPRGHLEKGGKLLISVNYPLKVHWIFASVQGDPREGVVQIQIRNDDNTIDRNNHAGKCIALALHKVV